MSTNFTNTTESSDPTESAWKTHWVIFSIIFLITGCFTWVLLIKAIHSAPELTRSYRLSIFSMVLTLCMSRALYLLLNPYEVNQALVDDTPVSILRLLYALGQPSLNAGYGLLHASFLKIAKLRNYEHEPLLKSRTILIIVVAYFTFGLVTEFVTLFVPGTIKMLLASTSLTIVCCLIITVTITYSGVRILKKATENKRVLSRSGSSHAG